MKLILLIVISCFSAFVYAADKESFLIDSAPFMSTKDTHKQALKWAVCSATYEVSASMFGDKPNTAQSFKNYANGASAAVLAVMFLGTEGKIPEDVDEFNARWKTAQLTSKSLPETQKTIMLSAFELAETKEKQTLFFDKLTNTLTVCTENLEAQQFYIDMLRDLMSSGLFELPESTK